MTCKPILVDHDAVLLTGSEIRLGTLIPFPEIRPEFPLRRGASVTRRNWKFHPFVIIAF